MKTIEFKKILKEKTPQEIIGLHTHWKIYLTNKQLQQVIDLKNK